MYKVNYFSPSGNAFHLAKILANYLSPFGVELSPLEFTTPESLSKNYHLVLVYPIHGFNAPRIVKRFVKDLPKELFESVSLIAVGCNRSWVNDAVSKDLRRVLKKKSYCVFTDEVLAMPLTFIMNFPDDLNLKLIAESETKIKEIGKAITNKEISEKKIKVKSYIINFIGKFESYAARFFGLELHAGKECNSCGTCRKNCPVKNIKQDKKGKPKFGFSCLMCMRCIYNCPHKAISPRFSKFLPIKNGYSLSKYLKTK